MITFDSQEAFEDAVMAVLKQRLLLSVDVSMVNSREYYSRDVVPEVTIDINDTVEDGYGLIVRGSGRPF